MKSGLSYRIEQDRKNKKATGIAAKKFTTRVSKKKPATLRRLAAGRKMETQP